MFEVHLLVSWVVIDLGYDFSGTNISINSWYKTAVQGPKHKFILMNKNFKDYCSNNWKGIWIYTLVKMKIPNINLYGPKHKLVETIRAKTYPKSFYQKEKTYPKSKPKYHLWFLEQIN
jgi:hypothetical protein